ncbi:MAG: hypothetical protein CSA58_08735 [Micrococcales bacterium]|nr:MAG: hypothetical protein CSB46_03930 [Micrococcales bacterium]PIE26569.1 MAG: hypothetical protein CSA58_08735 [Micrococcales bacterium]
MTTPEWNAAWSAALDEMEWDLQQAEELLSAVHRNDAMPVAAELLGRRWTAPGNLGPLPHPLLGRAQRLLQRQTDVGAQLADAAAAARKHAHAAQAAVERAPAPAVFVDMAM